MIWRSSVVRSARIDFRPGDGPSLPSGANLQLAQDLGKYINSFQWRGGDPPR